MVDLPPDMQQRRSIEDRAVELGVERRELQRALDTNSERIRRLLPEAVAAGIPLEQYAKMVGVSRQTLHHWNAELT